MLSYLFYTDDAIFVGDWDHGPIKKISPILKCFQISSGLKVHFHKSRFFGTCIVDYEFQRMAKILACVKSSFLSIYLGVQVGASMLRNKNWKPIIEKFPSKLSNWKANTLSSRRRLSLIKSVCGSLLT